MKPIKMLGLAALAALLAMALVGVSSAMAESTALCKADESPCKAANEVTHVHEETLTGNKAKLLSSIGTIECNALFLGDTSELSAVGAPLSIIGKFTYNECKRGSENCTATEVSSLSIIAVLKLGHESADVTGEGKVNVHCGFFINCTYNGEGLAGAATGPLLSSFANGDVTISEQATKKEPGGICPEAGKLDISTMPLEKVYLSAPAGHYCVELTRAVSFWLNVNKAKTSECIEEDKTRVGKFALAVGRGGLASGTMVCVNMSEKVGLYKKAPAEGGECLEDDKENKSLYELGTVQ